jgi:hypothetical protein
MGPQTQREFFFVQAYIARTELLIFLFFLVQASNAACEPQYLADNENNYVQLRGFGGYNDMIASTKMHNNFFTSISFFYTIQN